MRSRNRRRHASNLGRRHVLHSHQPARPQAATLSVILRAALLTLTWFFAGSVRKLLFIGQDNRYSGSTTPMSLWLLLTIAACLTAQAARTKTPAAAPRFPQDYVQNGHNRFDFGDYQMILITLIALVSYLVHVFQFLAGVELRAAASLPDVDTTILGLFGIGHGASLVKKSVSDVKS